MGRDVETRGQILGVFRALRIVSDDPERARLLSEVLAPARPTVLSFVNAHAINLAWSDDAFRRALLGADVLLRDGVGMKIAMRCLRMPAGLNMNGTDLIPRIVDGAAGSAVALFGTREPHLGAAAKACGDRGAEIVATLDGFLPTDAYVDEAKRARPRLVVLGMGMPRQEEVADALCRALDHPVLIVNGGAILDFMGGKVVRAPAAWRRVGMEWAFRLLQEPSRLWRRYLVGNLAFLLRVAWLRSARSVAGPRVETSRE